jgi:putative zinc finger/helix-turn-helix YgiT family protein
MQMKKAFCPHCDDDQEVSVQKTKGVYQVRDDNIASYEYIAVCSKCGSKLWVGELEAGNQARLYDAYRRKNGLLSATEIKMIREKFGLSQRALSKLLSWGEVTLHRYENGALQDKAHDTVLRLVADPKNMLTLLERNKTNLPRKVAEELNQKLGLLMGGEAAHPPTDSTGAIGEDSLTELNGYTTFAPDKLEGMILFFAGSYQPCFKTRLNKLLFYADFLHFKETARSISGSRYQAFQYGPVPENYQDVLEAMQAEGAIELSEEVFEPYQGEGKSFAGENVVAKVNWQPNLFTASEIECLQLVADVFNGWSASKIKDYSHDEPAYKSSSPLDYISYKKADTLRISL